MWFLYIEWSWPFALLRTFPFQRSGLLFRIQLKWCLGESVQRSLEIFNALLWSDWQRPLIWHVAKVFLELLKFVFRVVTILRLRNLGKPLSFLLPVLYLSVSFKLLIEAVFILTGVFSFLLVTRQFSVLFKQILYRFGLFERFFLLIWQPHLSESLRRCVREINRWRSL